MPQGLRFSPPDVLLTQEIRWLRAGAFGPRGQPPPPPPDGAAFVETTVSLDLVPRLVTRLGYPHPGRVDLRHLERPDV